MKVILKTQKGALKAAVLALLSVVVLSGCAQSADSGDLSGTDAGQFSKPPMIYVSDDNVYLACAEKKVLLGTQKEIVGYDNLQHGQMFYKGDYIYYLKSRQLMQAASDLSSPPEVLAEGVCTMNASQDGEKALYIKDIEDITGTLYLWERGEEPQTIAKTVLPVNFGFSPQGKCIYYTVLEDEENIALYAVKNNGEPVLVMRCKDAPTTDFGIDVCIDSVFADDEGKVLFSINDNSAVVHWGYNEAGEITIIEEDAGNGIYLFGGSGESERITQEGTIVKMLGGADEFIYTVWTDYLPRIYYKAPGKAPGEVCSKDCNAYSSSDFGFYDFYNENENRDDRELLLLEYKHTSQESYGTLYYVKLGGDRVKIAETDGEGESLRNDIFNCVVYMREGSTYAARKTGGGWSEQRLSDKNITYRCRFDAAGSYLYYIDSEVTSKLDDEIGGYITENTPGPLYRYSVASGETEKLADGIAKVFVAGNNAYSVSDAGTLCRAGQAVAISVKGRVVLAQRTQGGDYILCDNGLYFLADGSENTVQLFPDGLRLLFGDTPIYMPPLDKTPDYAMLILTKDAKYCLAQLDGEVGGGEEQTLTAEEDIRLARAMADAESYHKQAFSDFADGFEYYIKYIVGADEEYKDKARKSLRAAVDEGGYDMN